MAETLQTVEASLQCAVAFVKLLEWADRYRKADQTAQSALQTVKEVKRLLKQIHATLKQRVQLPDSHPYKRNDEKILYNVLKAAHNCKDHLQAGMDDIFGKDAVNFVRRTVRRARIASSSGRLKRLREDLRSDMEMLGLYLMILQCHDNTLSHCGNTAFRETANGFEQHSLFEMMQFQELLRALRSHASGQFVPGVWSEETTSSSLNTGDDLPKNHDALLESREDAKSVLHALSEFSNNRATEEPKDAETLSKETLQPKKDSIISQEQPFSIEVLESMMRKFSLRAEEAQKGGDWPKARTALEGFLSTRKQAAGVAGNAVMSDPAVEEALIKVLLQLNHWNEALQCVDEVEHQSGNPLPPHDRTNGSNVVSSKDLDQAHRDQLRALIFLDRHAKSLSREIHLANDDVERAQRSARRAYNTHHAYIKQTSDREAMGRYEVSVRLLETSLRILDVQGGVDADCILERAEEICGHPIPPLAIVDEKLEQEDDPDFFDFKIEPGAAANTGDEIARSPTSSGLDEKARSHTPPDWSNPNLTEAAKMGRVVDIRRYLQTHPDAVIDEQDEDGWTALHHATHAGNEELVKLLIPHTRSDIRTSDDGKATALLVAVKRDKAHYGTIQALAQHRLFVDSRFADESTVLHYAVDREDTTATAALLSAANGLALLPVQDVAGMTPLHFCCSRGRVEQVEKILEHCDESVVDIRDRGKRLTALDMALSNACPEIVGMILQKHPSAAHSDSSRPALERYLAAAKERARGDDGVRDSSESSSE